MSTTKVKLITPMVGNYVKDGKFAGHYSHSKGDEIELPTEEAKRYIAKGYAQPINTK